jgi:hypothetical protein
MRHELINDDLSQNLLLKILFSSHAVDPEQLMALRPFIWKQWLDLCDQHRLKPLLYAQLKGRAILQTVPITMVAQLQLNYKKGHARALIFQRELIQITRILQDANIESIALKGAYLAFHSYPNIALRPMRDLDILVNKEQAIRAFDVLLRAGFQRDKNHMGDPKASLLTRHQLPLLKSASGIVFIEIHTRIFHTDSSKQSEMLPKVEHNFYHRRLQKELANQQILYVGPTDLLIHLIVHSVYDHQFDNGPLILSDLIYVLRTEKIDWSLFWALAKNGNYERGCYLALKMVEHYNGPQNIEWPTSLANFSLQTINNLIKVSEEMMLRDIKNTSGINFVSQINQSHSFLEKVKVLFGKLAAPKNLISRKYPVKESSILIYAYYLKWWGRLAFESLPRYFQTRRHLQRTDDLENSIHLRNWLTSK